jgi:hypothetical protein
VEKIHTDIMKTSWDKEEDLGGKYALYSDGGIPSQVGWNTGERKGKSFWMAVD